MHSSALKVFGVVFFFTKIIWLWYSRSEWILYLQYTELPKCKIQVQIVFVLCLVFGLRIKKEDVKLFQVANIKI